MAYAHSQNSQGQRQLLTAHLRATSELAAKFAAPLGASEAALYLGLWHDLGKFHPDFQRYLLAVEAGKPPPSPDHKAAGALLARRHLGVVALLIQGHHGGLQAGSQLQAWLGDAARSAAVQEAVALARQTFADLDPSAPVPLPSHAQHDPLAAELFLRLLFSTLVDADFLDTEDHFFPERSEQRGGGVTIADLWSRFERAQASFSGKRHDKVGTARHEIYGHCLDAAQQPPGLFRLTVPTGGGKTRSAMGFALRHALLHGLQRVIVAIPFISITEQTADVYREILDPTGSERVILEHHSGTVQPDDEDVRWDRLAAENWDAPIVVTTTVQLFESLFSNKPSCTRKLHRLAKSVIILDEAQSLPAHLLTPILDTLRDLAAHYGSTIVFSTATQPAFSAIPAFRDLEAREIVPHPEHFFDLLRRVAYEWRTDPPVDWTEVAGSMAREDQVLAVVNTKANALALLDALDDLDARHLSTLLCGAHRRRVLSEVRRRLANGQPCRLVSTQVVEAGVDLDFPVVWRALGPLDAIIQAAGRCNREGRLASGRVVVFRPQEGGMPFGAYRAGAGIAEELLARGDLDLHGTAAPTQYFTRLFQTVTTDRDHVQEARASFDYPTVARLVRMIEDNTEEVVVTQYGSESERQEVSDRLDALRRGSANSRQVMRWLQPYLVHVYRHQAERYRRSGWISPVLDGLGEWCGKYDDRRGLVSEDLDPVDLVV